MSNPIGHNVALPVLLITGSITFLGFYLGKSMRWLRLPSIVGCMIIGMLAGPSFLNVLTDDLQNSLSFITELALGFVAFSIGLELSVKSLKRQGIGIISVIFAESFAAFFVVAIGVYLLTRSVPMALILGALAPASDPAGTIAVIKEYKTKGNLTRALYAVVGFDDGLAIIIFGFAASLAKMILTSQTSGAHENFFITLLEPIKEIVFSLGIGFILSIIISFLLRKLKNSADVLILIFAFVMIANGISAMMHLSLILTNMIIGLTIINTQRHEIVSKLEQQLSNIMPLFFILFFAIAGAHLHIKALPAMGILGAVYIICRAVGLIGGAQLGGLIGSLDDKVRKNIGLGILSQAGVAIGLALIIKQDFTGLGPLVANSLGEQVHAGDLIGTKAITIVAATSVFFLVVGPICAKIALTRGGEITK